METDDTRQKIIESASKQFLLEGCKKVTMDNIATNMHISKRTIYEQFENKEELLLACLSSHHEKMDRMLKYWLKKDDDPLISVMLMLKMSGDFLLLHANLMEEIKTSYADVYARFMRDKPHATKMCVIQQLKCAKERGVVRQGANVELASHVLMEVGKMLKSSEISDIHERSRMLSESVFTYVRGLMTLEAIESYNEREKEIRERMEKMSKGMRDLVR